MAPLSKDATGQNDIVTHRILSFVLVSCHLQGRMVTNCLSIIYNEIKGDVNGFPFDFAFFRGLGVMITLSLRDKESNCNKYSKDFRYRRGQPYPVQAH